LRTETQALGVWHVQPRRISDFDPVDYAAALIAVISLVFVVASFWWLNARRGTIASTKPRAYAFGGSGDLLRVRFPFAFFNTGAEALIIGDMRLLLDEDPGRPCLRWATTRERLRPAADDGFAYATPFSIPGRGTREIIAEFQPDTDMNWSPPHGVAHRLVLQAQIHPKDEWVELATFDWWAPPVASRAAYTAHRNEPTNAS
jgi:hypothetical protein